MRFSQALGFEGFPELQTSAREEYRRSVAAATKEPTATATAPRRAAVLARPERVRDGARRRPRQRRGDRAASIARRDVEAAIDAIARRRRVLIAGTDQMAFFASYLRHLLMLLDLPADLVASPSQEA